MKPNRHVYLLVCAIASYLFYIMGHIAAQSWLISLTWGVHRVVSEISRARELHKKYVLSKNLNVSVVGADLTHCCLSSATHRNCLAQCYRCSKCKQQVYIITFRLTENRNVDFLSKYRFCVFIFISATRIRSQCCILEKNY